MHTNFTIHQGEQKVLDVQWEPKPEIAKVAAFSKPAVRHVLRFDGLDDYVEIPTLKYDGSHPLTIEFIAKLPGDWPMHCHMTHHVMNQMGHDVANIVGADMKGVDAKLNRVLPGYMTMGAAGMHEMATMQMPQPTNWR